MFMFTEEEIKFFLDEAFKEARISYSKDEVPVGAVVVKDKKIIGRGHNLREEKKEIHSHAEIEAIIDAEKKLNTWKLDDCTLFVTLEPCFMCTGAISQSNIKSVYFACLDEQEGYILSKNINSNKNLPFLAYYCPQKEASEILKKFFQNKRK